MVGTTQSFGAGAGDVLVIKTDSNGAALWDKTYGGIGDEEGYYVQQTSDGGYVLSGYDKTSTLGYLVKTNISGNLIWSKTYLYGSAYIVQQTSDGGYIMIDRFDAGLRKVDNSGNLLWAKSYPVNTSPLAHSGQITSHGGFFLAGYIKDASGSRAYLIKTDSLGNSECANNLSITASNAATQVTSPALTVVNINPVVTPQTLTVSGGVNVATPCAVGTDELDKRENNFLLFPNPVANELYVISYTLLDKNAVEVYDALGQKVFSQKLTAKSQQQIINVSKWNSGVYFVKVKTSEGEKTHKLIVQH